MVNKAPAFFKVFIAESNSIDMAIPVSFTERMERAFPERVFLRDRHHHIWIVKIAKVGNYWYFVDGWDKFVKDYRLLSGDIMVFEYFSDYLFNVKVYGPFSMEKRVVSNNNREEPIEHNDMDCADHHEEEGVENDRDSSFTRRGHNNEDDEDEVTDDADYMPKRRRVNEDEEVVQDNVNNNNGASSSRSTKQSLKYLYPRCYGMEIFEAGLAKQPKNPYFVTKILPKRRADLFIPMDVIKDHELQLSHEIILVDPNGREFNARCRQWSDGRSLLSGGWSPLCSVNFVTPQDSCICEFVPRKGDPRQFLHVSFVRAD